MTKNIKMHIKN